MKGTSKGTPKGTGGLRVCLADCWCDGHREFRITNTHLSLSLDESLRAIAYTRPESIALHI